MNLAIKIGGLSYMITSAVIMTWTYLNAFLSPTKRTIVAINDLGELPYELPLIVVGVIFFLLYIILWIKEN